MGINGKDRFSFRKGYRGRTVFLIFDFIFLSMMMAVMILPLLKVLVDSIDPTSYGVRLWPRVIDFSAYEKILTTSSMYQPFLVSILTTVVGTTFGLSVITLGAYVLIQKDMPGHRFLGKLVLFTMLFNGGLIPTYLTIKNLGLMNNLLAVIVPCSVSAYNTILMKSFFAGIPNELFESATVDGCTPFGCFWRIMLPLSKPALASVGLFIAVGLWNEYMHFILYITNPRWQNFQVKVRSLILEDGLSGTAITLSQDMLKAATVVVVILPFLFVYPFIQKYFTKGVTLGAVKG
jgi:putative aldouronate transport system permease protein